MDEKMLFALNPVGINSGKGKRQQKKEVTGQKGRREKCPSHQLSSVVSEQRSILKTRHLLCGRVNFSWLFDVGLRRRLAACVCGRQETRAPEWSGVNKALKHQTLPRGSHPTERIRTFTTRTPLQEVWEGD